MTDIVIRVENLGKRYQLGASKSGSFRESMSSLFRRNSAGHPASNPTPYPRRPNPQNPSHSESAPIPNPQSLTPKDFWALQDINFEIKRGEAVGIIGRNGAGKSTLLKILSRITEPTTGRFEIFGRVSSLLEVGTGFHPELTGRENVYLNGTILGMKRREVKAKFDEIVAFSGVEKFIDTPVKHYSSGMQVRLAFAVAAHLEPEILIIDEVLAVGDAEFQKKCLGKMEDVTGEGRTVLFVSHNMGAVQALCQKGIVLRNGRSEYCGSISDGVDYYISRLSSLSIKSKENLSSFINKVDITKNNKEKSEHFLYGDDIVFELYVSNKFDKEYHNIGFYILDPLGSKIGAVTSIMKNPVDDCDYGLDEKIVFKINSPPLVEGDYYIDIVVSNKTGGRLDYIASAAKFKMLASDVYGTGAKINSSLGKIYFDVEASYVLKTEICT